MKITLEQKQETENFYQELFTEARRSATYKSQLISDPKTVISNLKGVDVSRYNKINFSVEDQTDTNIIYLNIPRKAQEDGSIQLSDDELDIVSGGEGPILIACAVVTVLGGLFALGVSLYSGSHQHCK